jgi:hypothetical protein
MRGNIEDEKINLIVAFPFEKTASLVVLFLPGECAWIESRCRKIHRSAVEISNFVAVAHKHS